jgi:hypothetical protein
MLLEVLVPSEFYLGQNFPNPFNEETKIKYCLPLKCNVKLNLFNTEGEVVKELVNNIQEAGTYEIKLNGCELSEGQYYFVIEAIDLGSGLKQVFNDTKKMILLK